MNYSKVSVFGAGAMGAGIAHVLAAASVAVVLIDVTADLVAQGIKRIEARCASDVKRGKLTPEASDGLMARITGSTAQEVAGASDLVIEEIIEDRTIKGDLFQSLNRFCPPECVFATNTSTLSVTDLASLSGRPDRFLGLHFFNPVHAMKLVEVIPGLDTGREIVEGAAAAMKEIKKVPIIVQDCPGFLVNRILLSYVNEALLAAEEGISPEVIDGEIRKIGFPMGPMELSDMVGWDVSLHTFPILHQAYGDRFPALKLVQKLNDTGRLGLKSGKGVYRNGQIDDEYRAMVAAIGSKGSGATFTVNRLMLKQINEAIYCLQEGVASAEEIDRAMVLGTGFPGGPLHWAG
jgi:3-hydroxyacyl-CoA dehydrogenase